MSRRDDSVPVRHMLDAARDVMSLVAGKSRGEFEADAMLNGAVQHLLTRIGAHADRVTARTQQRSPAVPWRHLIEYAELLQRDYDRVDQAMLWREVSANVPYLVTVLEPIASELTHTGPVEHKRNRGTQGATLAVPADLIEAFCRKHHIRTLSFFGSVLRDDFGPDSDIDVLVEFEPGYVPGLAFFGMADELAAILGRPVDLMTPESLSPYFRDEVLAEAEIQYARPS